MTKEQMLITAVITLGGVVSVLFAYLRSVDARQQRKLDECEEDRNGLWETLTDAGISVRRRRHKLGSDPETRGRHE